MLAGDISLAAMGAGETVEANLSGADTIMLTGDYTTLLYSIMANPGISKFADLKGKKVGVTKRGGSPDTALRLALTKMGMNPDKDMTIISAGAAVPDILTGMAAGAVDAGVLSPPVLFAAKKQGYTEVLNIGSVDIPYVWQGINTTKSYLAKNRETVRKFMKGYIEGIARFKQDKEFAKKVMAKYTKSEDQQELEDSYTYTVPSLRTVPYVTKEGIETLLGFSQNPNAKTSKPEDFYDNSFIKELDDSGFIKGLYRVAPGNLRQTRPRQVVSR